jgi:hypothetical protein
VAAEAGCQLLNTSGPQCTNQQYSLFKATRMDVDFSSVYERHDNGEGWGRGYSAFKQADWVASKAQYGEWMQIDLRKMRSVAGIMMAGGWNTHWHTQAFKVMVSSDAETWYEVECGRIFDPGYQYYHSLPRPEWFDNPVMTRYVRIYPLEWYGMPGGRFSIMLCSKCEEGACETNELTNGQSLTSAEAVGRTYLVSPNAQYILQMQVCLLCHHQHKPYSEICNNSELPGAWSAGDAAFVFCFPNGVKSAHARLCLMSV